MSAYLFHPPPFPETDPKMTRKVPSTDLNRGGR
jgi:hypothetical protein